MQCYNVIQTGIKNPNIIEKHNFASKTTNERGKTIVFFNILIESDISYNWQL